MARLKTHKEDCMRLLGEEFEEVHLWLDEFARVWKPEKYLEYHRQFRHNQEGLDDIVELFGERGLLAAKIHFIRDTEEYTLKKPMSEVKLEEIDELMKRALKYI